MRRPPRQRAFWRLNWVGPFALVGLCHAYLFASLIAPLTSLAQAAPAARAPDAPLAEADGIEPTCTGDALLTAAAEAVVCDTPLADADCARDVQTALAADLAHCRGDDAPLEFAMLEPAQMAKLTPIDPEPLLDSITPEAQAQFEAQQQAEQVAIAEAAEKQKELLPEDVQVVETAKPALEIAPDQAKFVSEYNTKVAQETVARGAIREKMAEKPAAAELPVRPNAPDPTSPKPPTDRPPSMAENAPDAPGKLSMRAPGAVSPGELAQDQHTRGDANGKIGPAGDGTALRRGDGAIDQGRRDPIDPTPGQGGGGGGAPHVPNLRPTEEQLSRVVGGGSVDHYDDVEEGEVTAVNSKQWIGADFMNRTKRLVAQEWNPAAVWSRFDPTGTVYGFKTRITVLRVTLTPDGALAKTTVVRGSGVDVLDDEAIRAFKAAGPFPNPPSVLRGDDGMVAFTFGFYFEIDGGRSSWKVLRQ